MSTESTMEESSRISKLLADNCTVLTYGVIGGKSVAKKAVRKSGPVAKKGVGTPLCSVLQWGTKWNKI
ncbi:hypothetical protein MAR_001305 [Mya arenaria]|uniref:Uncharacterized protein n=1 Tax=Mya arenaria TaxID=6604 RepID=A0ABY7FEN9_MYAAR|nr:hypothetical protein MAR_001305 [Mya arenaria]